MNNRAKGIDAETMACEYMTAHGMTVLERNYACKTGEIDIVAEDGGYLIFCEVKARKNALYGYPVEAVTPQKITQIVRTAQWYLKSKRKVDADVRFDLALVDTTKETLDYIPNAFTADDMGRRNRW